MKVMIELFKFYLKTYLTNIICAFLFAAIGFVTIRIGVYLPLTGASDSVVLIAQLITFFVIFISLFFWHITKS